MALSVMFTIAHDYFLHMHEMRLLGKKQMHLHLSRNKKDDIVHFTCFGAFALNECKLTSSKIDHLPVPDKPCIHNYLDH